MQKNKYLIYNINRFTSFHVSIFYSRGQLGGGARSTCPRLTTDLALTLTATATLSSARLVALLRATLSSATFVGHHHENAVQSCHVDDATLALNPEQCTQHQCASVCNSMCECVCLSVYCNACLSLAQSGRGAGVATALLLPWLS